MRPPHGRWPPLWEPVTCRYHGKRPSKNRADGRGRTGDLVLTMDALYQLSYVGTARMVSLGLRKAMLAST